MFKRCVSLQQMVVIFTKTLATTLSHALADGRQWQRADIIILCGTWEWQCASSVLLQLVLRPLRFNSSRLWQVLFLQHSMLYCYTDMRSCGLWDMKQTIVWLKPSSSSGDVIVYINDICVLGTTHADVVKLFQSVPIGQSVTLVLCRGYPLPFDPEDPSGAASASLTPIGLEHRPLVVNGRSSYDPYLEYLSLSSQLPPQALAQAGASHPGDTHLDGSSLPPTTPGSASALTPHNDNVSIGSSGTAGVAGATTQGAELLTVTMVKGAEGFGFTIADSPTGQRVKQVMYRLFVHSLNNKHITPETGPNLLDTFIVFPWLCVRN